MKGIFLDDERRVEDVTWVKLPDVEWTIVRTFDEMAQLIRDGKWVGYDYISFDHDLNQTTHESGVSPDGYTLIKMLVDSALDTGNRLPLCLFHTQNPIGRTNMESYYFNYLDVVFCVE